jgi:uncharacterized protein (DUF2062 family)
MKFVFNKINHYYRKLWIQLVHYCKTTDNRKAALAISVGICIGIIPFLGFTFILVSLAGFALRVNQLVIQAAHFLVAPLQILLIYPFMRLGMYIFGDHQHSISEQTIQAFHENFFQGAIQFSGIVVGGIATWLIVSVVLSLVLYRILLFYFNRSRIFSTVKVDGLK